MGWEPHEKVKDLFHTDARFIVLSIPAAPVAHGVAGDSVVLVGFSAFKFDYEEGEKLLSWSAIFSRILIKIFK